MADHLLKVALAQIAPVWLNREETLQKIKKSIGEASAENTPHLDKILKKAPAILANGGSCIAGTDGEWLLPPVVNKEGLIIETLDFNRIYEEWQNFDPVGHYSRPDVTKLIVNRKRQAAVSYKD